MRGRFDVSVEQWHHRSFHRSRKRLALISRKWSFASALQNSGAVREWILGEHGIVPGRPQCNDSPRTQLTYNGFSPAVYDSLGGYTNAFIAKKPQEPIYHGSIEVHKGEGPLKCRAV
jgi:hypothetical protein